MLGMGGLTILLLSPPDESGYPGDALTREASRPWPLLLSVLALFTWLALGQPPPRLASANYRAAPGQAWFKGNTHTHTTNSDGDSTPEVVTRWYQDHGYSFLVLSDHNYLTAEGSFPYEKKDGFLLIQGEEVSATYQATAAEPRRPVHVNALDLKAVIEPFNGRTAAETVQANVDRIRAAQAVPHVNHPNFRWALSADDLMKIHGCRLLEIWNGHPTVHNQGGGGVPGMEEVWDRLLTAGVVLYGIAVDDAHHFKGEFAADRVNPGRGWIHVRARALRPGALMESLERGDFYASTGPLLEDVTADDSGLRLRISPTLDFKYTTFFYGKAGQLLASSPDPSPSYAFRGDEGYVRVKVVDSAGRAAWVQPVFVERGTR
jgi:hypothetical protein